MTSASAARSAGRPQDAFKALLLGGSALCGVALLSLGDGADAANILPTQAAVDLAVTGSGSLATKVLSGGVVTPGTVTYTSTGATAAVTLTSAPRTLIDWTTFEVGTGNTLTFNFSASTDIVVNRVPTTVPINIDTGGLVQGKVGGSQGGNIWFLSDAGVFIKGSVTAAGVLATNNISVLDLSLLQTSLPALKTQLSALSGLIDLSGTVTASGAEVDPTTGNIVLSGTLDTSFSGAADLETVGTISQSGGGILAASLTGSSAGGASLTKTNVFATLDGFTNTGVGNVSISDTPIVFMTVAKPVDAGSGNTLTLTANSGGLFVNADLSAAGGAVSLNSASTILQTSGVITTGALSGTSAGAVSLTDANLFDSLAGFTNTGVGDVSVTDAKSTGLTVTSAVDVGAGNNLTLTTTNGGPLALNADLSAATATVTLSAAGAITQGVSVITSSDVTGSSDGGVSLTGANKFSNFKNFTNTTSGDVVVNDAQNLTLDTVVNTVGSMNFTSTGSVTSVASSALAPGQDLIVTAGTAVDLKKAPVIGRDYIVTGKTFTNKTLQPTFSPGRDFTVHALQTFALSTNLTATRNLTVTSTGSLDTTGATLAATGGTLSLSGATALTVGDTSAISGGTTFATTTSGDITLTGAVTATGQLVTLNSVGVVDGTAATISSAAITGTSVGGATLTGANSFDSLAGFTNTGVGDVSIKDTKASGLTVTGAVDAGSGNILTLTTTAGGTLTLSADLSAAGAGAVNLVSAGVLSQSTGVITTGTLSGSSKGGATLTDANKVGTFSNFTNTTGGDVSFSDAQNLTADTIANAVGSIAIAATGSLDVTGGGVTSGFDLTLSAGTSLTQAAGPTVVRDYTITAATFDTNSLTPAFTPGRDVTVHALSALTLATDLTATRSLTVTSTGALDTSTQTLTATGGTLSLTGVGGLTVGATVATAGATSFTTTTSGAIGLTGAVNATGQSVTLTSAGAISETLAGAITATTVQGSSVGGASLTKANAFDTLAGFTNTGVGAVSITDAKAGGLTVSSTVDAGSGNALTLTTTSGGALTLSADLSAATGSVSLVSAGALSQTSGVITTAALNGSSAGGATLTDANLFDSLAGFTNTGAGNLSIKDAKSTGLTVSAAVDAGTGNSLNLTTTNGGALALQGDLLASAGSVNLAVSGAVSQTSGVITTASLTGTSAGGASLTDNNLFDTLAGFSNLGVGALSITDAKATGLTVSSAVQAGSGNTLTLTTKAGGDLTLSATLGAPLGAVVLSSAGALSQTTGQIITASLSGSSTGGASLTGNNFFDNLAGFTNSGAGNVSVSDAQPTGLTVSAAVDAGAGGNTLKLTTSGGGIALSANVTATTGTIDLVSAGAVSQSAGIVTATTLNGSSDGGAVLSAANKVAAFSSFTNTTSGDIVFSDAQDLSVSSLSNAVGSINLSSTGNLSLTGAALNSGFDLNLSAGATLDAASAPTIVRDYSITATTFAGQSFNPTFSPGRDYTINSLAPMTLTSSITATRSLTVTSTGALDTTGATLTASAGALTLTAATGLTVKDTVATSGATTFSTTTSGPITLTGAVSAAGQTVNLTSKGAIAQTGGAITASAIAGASVGGATLTGGNQFDTLAGFTNTGVGNVSMTDGKSSGLTVSSAVDAGSGNTVTLTTINGGPLALSANVTAASGTIDLVSAGAISQSTGILTASTLNGASDGGAVLSGANKVATFSTFTNTTSGDIVFNDAQTLTTNAIANAVGSISLSSTGNLSLTGAALNSGVDLILSAGATLDLAAAPTIVRDYSITALSFTGQSFSPNFSPGRDYTINALAPLTLTSSITAPRNLILTSVGTITQTGGVITAVGLGGSSVGGASLNQANLFDNLVGFTNSGAGGLSVTDARATGLTVTSAVNAGTGGIALTTTNGGSLTLSAVLAAASGTVNLVSAGQLSQTAGTIAATTLIGSSVGGADLSAANQFNTLAGFINTGAGTVTLTDAKTTGFTVSATVDAGSTNTLNLTSTGSGGLTLSANVTAASGTVNLSSGGATTQTSGIITASTLTSATNGAATLTRANQVASLGAFTNGGAGSLSFSDAISSGLTVSTAINAGAGDIALTTTAATGTLTVAANLTTSTANQINLVSAGSLAQSAGVITTGALTGSSVGVATLAKANLFDSLAGFTNTGLGAVSITDAKASGLTVTSAVDAGTSNSLTLTTTNGGPLTLSANLTAVGGSVGLSSAGALSQTAGVITTAVLNGSSAGGANLSKANQFDALAGFTNTGVGNVAITDAKATGLTTSGAIDAGSGNTLTLTTTNGGSLTLQGNVTASSGAVDLVSAGALTQSGGVITTGALSGTSAGGASLTAANLFGALAGFTNTGVGNVSITDAKGSGLTVTSSVNAGSLNTLNLTTTNGGPMTLSASLSAAAGTINLISAGALSQTTGVITTATLTGSSAGGASLTRANLFDTLALFINTGVGAVSITDAKSSGLTVSATVDAGSNNTLTLTTTAGGSLTLQGNLTALSGAVDLVSAGVLTQSSGVVTTASLSGASAGGASLTGANQFDTLSSFINAGSGGIAVSDAKTSGLTLTGNVTAASGTVALVSAGALNQTFGVITALNLTGSSAGGASLIGANLFDTLAGFTNTGVGNVAIADAKASGLNVTSAVDSGSGNSLSLTTINGGPLTLAANLTAASSSVSLASAGALSQTAGVITSATLTGSSAGGASLAKANLFDSLAGFTNTGVGAVSILDAKASGLKVTSAVDGGSGNTLTLTTTNGGALTLAANVTAASGTVDLVSAGALAQTAGILTTGAITGTSLGGASLTGSNLFDSLAGFTNAGVGNVAITDAKSSGLTVTAAVDAASGNTLTLTTTNGGPLTLSANLTAAAGTVDLVSAGALAQTSGVVTTATLTGSSVGGGNLARANLFDSLAGFTNTGVGNLSITDAKASGLTVTAAVDAGSGNTLTLTTTNGGSLTVQGDLTASSGAVDLQSSGVLTQSSGVITVGSLTGSSAGGASLNDANLFDSLAGFTNTGVGPVSILDAKASGLTVTSAVDAGAGNALTLRTSNGGTLTLAANLTAAAGIVNLVSAGAMSQTTGVITTAALTGSSAGGASLTDANLFDQLTGFANTGVGNVSITDAKASGLSVSSAVDAGSGNSLTLTTTNGGALILGADLTAASGTVDLVSAGNLTQAAGIITTAVITGSSAGGASLTDANLFDTLAGFTNTGAGNVAVLDAKASGLTVTSAVDAGAGNTLTLTTTNGGPLTLAADLNAVAGTVDLISAGSLAQTSGVITTAAFTGSSAGGASLTDANVFSSLAGFTNTGVGNVSITGAKASGLTVTSAVDAGAGNTLTVTTTNGGSLTLAADLTAAAGAVDLISAGVLSQTTGVITTTSLTGSSAGGATLTDANLFDSLAGFTNTGAGNVLVTDAKSSGLTVTSAVDAGAGNTLTLTTTNGGPLTLAANITAASGAVDLVSAGILSQTAGIITTGTLAGSSVGGAALTDANLFDTLAGFSNSGVGAVSILDAKASGLTVSSAVDAGSGNTLTLTTTNGGPLTLAANVTAALGAVDLVSAGAVSQTSGVITTATLKGASAGGASLTRSNLFDTLAGFSNTGVGNVSITDAKASGLTVNAAVDAGSGNTLTLTTSNGGPLTLSANITAASGTVDLLSAGTLSQTAGVITTSILTGASVGGGSLTDANLFDTLAGFTNTGVGNLSITDAKASGLSVTSAVNAGAGNTLTLTTANGGSLTLSANLTSASGAVDLVSAGALSQTAGVITTATLTGSSAGGASLTDANLFDTLAGLSNSGVGAVSILDAKASGLTVTSAVDAGAGNTLTLTTTNGGPLALAANVTAASGTVNLVSAGALSQTAGVITTAALKGSSVGGASLTDANLFDNLAGFTNSGVGNVAITDAKASGLTVGAAVDAGSGNTLTLTTTNSGALTLAANVTAASGTVDLIASGPIAQTAGVITTATLTGSSVGGASLAGANLFDALAGFTNAGAGNVSIVDAKASGLTVSTSVDAGPGATLTLTTTNGGALTLAADLTAASGAVDLVSAGALTQTAGVITTAALTGSSVGGASLTDANLFDTLAGFTNVGSGNVSVLDAKASGLAVTAAVDAGSGSALHLTTTNGGPMTLAASLTAPTQFDLVSAGVLTQTAGIITTGTFSGSSVGGASLTDANAISTLTNFVNQASGAVMLTNSASLAVSGGIDNAVGGTGAGRDIGVTLTAGSLTGTGTFSAGRDVALNSAAGALTFNSATAGDDLVLRAAGAVSVSGPLAATGGASTVDKADATATGDVLAAASPLSVFGKAYSSLTDDAHIDVRAAGGDITLASALNAAGDVRLQAVSGGILTADITAGGAIILDAATSIDRGSASSDVLSAGGNVAAQAASGDVTLQTVSATTGDVVLRAAVGNVSLVSASAGDDLLIRAGASASVTGSLTAGTSGETSGLADAFLTNAPSQAMSIFGQGYSSVTGGSQVDVVASGAVSIGGGVTATGGASDVRIVAKGLDNGGTPVLGVAGAIAAGQDVALDATGGGTSTQGSISVGGATSAGRDIAARSANGSVGLTSLSAGGAIVLVAQSGGVTLDGSASASGSAGAGIGQTLFGTVSAPLKGLFVQAPQTIFVGAASFADKGYGRTQPSSLTAGKAIAISVTDKTGLVLADAKPTSGSWVKASTLAAPTVTLFETKGDMTVGDATVNSPVTTMKLYTDGLVKVTGKFAPATDDTVDLTVGDQTLNVWTPTNVEVINDPSGTPHGAIGFTTVTGTGVYSTTPQTFHSATLFATNGFLAGSQEFVDANLSQTTVAQQRLIDPSRPVPTTQANTSGAIMLAVGDLSLTAGSMIVQQNTTGLRTTNGTGYYITRNLTLGAYTPFPVAIDLFGVFTKPGSTIPITGAAAADVTQITIDPSLNGSPFRALYRVNSCVVGQLGNCTPTSDGITSIPLDELSRGALLSRDELDVEDPTITGAPNEEIWRMPDDRQ